MCPNQVEWAVLATPSDHRQESREGWGRGAKMDLRARKADFNQQEKQNGTPVSTPKLSDPWSFVAVPSEASEFFWVPRTVSDFSLGTTGPGLAWEEIRSGGICFFLLKEPRSL